MEGQRYNDVEADSSPRSSQSAIQPTVPPDTPRGNPSQDQSAGQPNVAPDVPQVNALQADKGVPHEDVLQVNPPQDDDGIPDQDAAVPQHDPIMELQDHVEQYLQHGNLATVPENELDNLINETRQKIERVLDHTKSPDSNPLKSHST